MRQALGGPRLLLRRLREVMSEQMSAQARLDKIVVLIASNMVAEVCSVYVKRADGALELYATEGLNREAVHLTTMRADEGLVGLIAREAERWLWPMPRIIRPSPTSRKRAKRSMPLSQACRSCAPATRSACSWCRTCQARLFRRGNGGAADNRDDPRGAGGRRRTRSARPPRLGRHGHPPGADLTGQSVAEGVGLGHVVLHEPRIEIKNLVADDPQEELRRLNAAMEKMRASIDDLMEVGSLGGAGEHRDVLETFRMFAHDRGWIRRLQEAINTGLTAEAAVERVQSDARARLLRQTDPYLRERLHDLDDLANRLLHE